MSFISDPLGTGALLHAHATTHSAPPVLDPHRPSAYCVDCIAGGGKTYAALDYAARIAEVGHRVIIALPSTALIAQSLADLRRRHPETTSATITSQTHPKRVVSAIIAHSRASIGAEVGEALFVSHAALMMLPFLHERRGWDLIIDEALPATASVEHRDIPRGLLGCLRVAPEGLAYSRITARSPDIFKRIMQDRASAKGDAYRDLATMLLNRKYDVYALTSQISAAKAGGCGLVTFYSVLRADALEGWRTVTVMSACMRDTLMHRVMLLGGMQWMSHHAISKRLRATRHDNGSLLTIYYAQEQPWSKRQRDASAFGGATSVLDEIMLASRAAFDEQPYAYLVNNDRADCFDGLGGDRLPNTSHGLNRYQHLHNAVACSALNLTPAHISFLRDRGIDADAIRDSVYHSTTYQAAMRISLRDLQSDEAKHLVVADRGCADYMAARFPGCRVTCLPSRIKEREASAGGRQARHGSDAAKTREHRERVKKRLVDGVEVLATRFWAAETDTIPYVPCSGSVSEFDAQIGMSVYSSIYSDQVFGVLPYGSHDEFIAGLREVFHPTKHADKHDNALISPSRFDAARAAGTSRGRANVAYANGIWLDNDGGDLAHGDLAALSPHLRVVAYNSYSSTAQTPGIHPDDAPDDGGGLHGDHASDHRRDREVGIPGCGLPAQTSWPHAARLRLRPVQNLSRKPVLLAMPAGRCFRPDLG